MEKEIKLCLIMDCKNMITVDKEYCSSCTQDLREVYLEQMFQDDTDKKH